MDESALVVACQGGNLDAFDGLYRAYVQPIYGFIYRRTLVRETAEDLTSTVFMKAMEKIGGFDPQKGVFAAWIFRIARNTVTDHYRTSRPHLTIEDVWDLQSDEDVSASAEHRFAYEELRTAMKKLDSEKRDILLMRLWDGLSYKEIAEIAGKTEGNCKVIVSRTLETLRTSLPLLLFLALLSSLPLPL